MQFRPKQMTDAVLQIQLAKKRKFLEAYSQTNGNITDSSRIAGIDRTTYYNWLKDDSDFALQVLDHEAELNDEIRQVLIQKAAEGDMTAVIFYLKNRHPDFKPQPGVLQQFNTEGGSLEVKIINYADNAAV